MTSALIRRRAVAELGIRFPEELRLRFEDAAFVAEYLLRTTDPTVLFVPRAHYLYRQRADHSSTVQANRGDPRKYVDHLRHGFPRLIAAAIEQHGRVPRWAQNLMLYDQFWILRSSQKGEARHTRFPEQMYRDLDDLVSAYLTHIDAESIREFSIMSVEAWMRDALLIKKGEITHGQLLAGPRDERRGLRAVVYRHGEDAPTERVFVGEAVVEPRFAKTQGLEYVGRTIVWQRTIWLPAEARVRIALDGVDHYPQSPAGSGKPPFAPDDRGWRVRAHRLGHAVEAQVLRIGRGLNRRRGRSLAIVRRTLATRSVRSAQEFRNAWVFIDRDVDANDSGEDLYWWVRENHPEINAWFVVRRGTPDWERMSRQGARLVGYGEPEFFSLMAHADHLASSHADRFITDALPRRMRGRYVFTFLQHGVIKGDISEWLNRKRIDVFVTSTRAEYDYIVGPSPFKFGTKEVRLTGLPRHDALLKLAQRRDGGRASKVLIMPTWRDYLVGDMGKTSADRAQIAAFSQSRYARSWGSSCAAPRSPSSPNRGTSSSSCRTRTCTAIWRISTSRRTCAACRTRMRTSGIFSPTAPRWSPTTHPSHSTLPFCGFRFSTINSMPRSIGQGTPSGMGTSTTRTEASGRSHRMPARLPAHSSTSSRRGSRPSIVGAWKTPSRFGTEGTARGSSGRWSRRRGRPHSAGSPRWLSAASILSRHDRD
ncbi:CDP-glycerol glycerophosphotransferase family protein [Microbacterium elymi]|uniref:CDP-glycerol glycerophosphotransferase family protein n=1 Tax=Microbacterium elymi TaxID=2909587 RepID=A0ABY5NKN8_9MICO|nr:CDP-glycerol glycerophosphotransferase family protein [Microbacterium elymi]UUT35734.1 CDP-glycerol glycerophosphotransferase family protein [Microbacterium elymi]